MNNIWSPLNGELIVSLAANLNLETSQFELSLADVQILQNFGEARLRLIINIIINMKTDLENLCGTDLGLSEVLVVFMKKFLVSDFLLTIDKIIYEIQDFNKIGNQTLRNS